MRFPRMTTRRWMIAVAIAGVCFWMTLYLIRSVSYRRLAREHDLEAQLAVDGIIAMKVGLIRKVVDQATVERVLREAHDAAAYHARMRDK